MLKFVLLFQIISVHCHWLGPPEPTFGDMLISPNFPDFLSNEQIGKQSISINHQISKLKLKGSELSLPRNVVPISYKLKIRTILESSNPEEVLTAPGSVEIVVLCEVATDIITLHAQTKEYITIFEDKLWIQHFDTKYNNQTTLDNQYEGSIRVTSLSTPEKNDADFYQIQLSTILQPGNEYVIHLEFLTKISNTTLSGLYLSRYTDPVSGEKKFLAVTQFESIAARQMFPCFDEPDLKSTFEIIISRAEKYNSMSNMPLVYTEPDPDRLGYFLDHYLPTPKMSTYLVALVVSEFTCTIAPSSIYNKTIEACGPPHMVAEGGAIHAAHVSARILHFYEKLWQVPYPLPKMTSVAIPEFQAGAMENYGLNTYRISALMYYPGKSTEAERFSIESVIAHELAHQNFGNLVTCQSWNQIFLNEGFATFVSNLGLEEVSPEFEAESLGWYTSYFQRALIADADPNTHSVVLTEDYFGYFDDISYSKGASLIKMTENILSRKTLFNGLTQYLNSNSFGNTKYQTLFDALDFQARSDGTHPELASMVQIMETWTIQPGFPLVRVAWISEQLFHISQERFVRPAGSRDKKYIKYSSSAAVMKDKANLTSEHQNSLWHCPIFIAHSMDPNNRSSDGNYDTHPHYRPTLWLTKNESTKAWTSKSTVDWIIVNVEAKAFLRVLYDEKLSSAVENQLNTDFQVFSPITRAQLIGDAFECAWARYSSVTVALGRTRFLIYETDARVWTTALNNLKQIYSMITDQPDLFRNFRLYVSPRVNQALNAVGLEHLPEHKGQLVLYRGSLFIWGAMLGLPSVLSYSKTLVEISASERSLNLIPVDLRTEILCAAVIEGSVDTMNFIMEEYAKAKYDSSVRNLLVRSMGCTRNTDTIKRLLNTSSNSDFLHSQSDSYTLLQKLVVNPFSRSATFSYVREHLKNLLQHLSPEALTKILQTFSHFWNTEEQLTLMRELQTEFEEELNSVVETDKTIALIEENMVWMKIHGSEIKNWMQAQVQEEEYKIIS